MTFKHHDSRCAGQRQLAIRPGESEAADEHLVPYLGNIEWDVALMAMQKIGYEGTYLMELAGGASPATILEEARRARQRFERALAQK